MDPRIPTAARFQQAKNYTAAEPIYRQILQTQPNNPDALLLLGLLMHETGRHEPSVAMLRKAMGIAPKNPDIRRTIMGPLTSLGLLSDALIQAKEFVRLKPTDPDSHHALAIVLLRMNDYTAALPAARRAVELNNRSAPSHLALARALIGLKQFPQAMQSIDRALAITPNFADALINKGIILKETGRLDEAIAAYEAGLKLAPQNIAGLNNLGGCYLTKERAFDAIDLFERAAKLSPTMAMPRNNVGVALKMLGRIDEALPHFVAAAKLDPTYVDAINNIGTVHAALSHHEQAIAAYREALRVSPAFSSSFSNMLMLMLSVPDLSEEAIFREHREFGRRYADPVQTNIQPFSIDRDPDKRLRVAYISPDFREHSVRYFIEPIIKAHDRTQVHVTCYYTGLQRDEVTNHLAASADAWHVVTGLTDPQLAEMIRSHQIDILVDLAGHTAHGRLLAMALRPAPVQVTYLGYPATTGLTSVDYRLTDAVADPPGADTFYTEKLIRLPNAFFVYGDNPSIPFDPTLPADRNGFVTFGSFNSYTKIHATTLDAWAEILSAVPHSRLLMKSKSLENPSTQRVVREAFARRGVSADRLQLRAWVTMPEHRAMLSGIDLMLDTFPYNGHTTTCQSIWMGVPVLTWAGESFRSRVGASIMAQLRLPHFVCDSREQYVQRAIALASDLTPLRQLRPTLRDSMLHSALCDAPVFTRSLELAYRQMWRQWTNRERHAV